MTLGNTLREKRKAQEMTQQDLAEQLYVSRQTVSSWETGKSFPDIATLIAISEYFDLSLDALIKGDEAFIDNLKNEGTRYKLIQQGIFVGIFSGVSLVFSLGSFVQFVTSQNLALVNLPWIYLCIVVGICWLVYFYLTDMYFPVKQRRFRVLQFIIHLLLLLAFLLPLFLFGLSLLVLTGILSV